MTDRGIRASSAAALAFVFVGAVAATLLTVPDPWTRTGAVIAVVASVVGGVLAACKRTQQAGFVAVVIVAGLSIAMPGLDHLGQLLLPILVAPLASLYVGWRLPGAVARSLNALMIVLLAGGAVLNTGWWEQVTASAAFAILAVTTLVLLTEVSTGLAFALRIATDTDPLTGALNRRGLERALASFGRDGLWIAAIDLNGLKRINDRKGHAAGDEALRASVASWRASVDGNGLVARWGGDEFVLVLRAADESAARRFANEIRANSPHGFAMGLRGWDRRLGLAQTIALVDEELYADKRTVRPVPTSMIRIAEEAVRRARTTGASIRFRLVWLVAAVAFAASSTIAVVETGHLLNGVLSGMAGIMALTVAVRAGRPGPRLPDWLAVTWAASNIALTTARTIVHPDSGVLIQGLFVLPLATSIVAASASPRIARISFAALAACILVVQGSPERIAILGLGPLLVSLVTSALIVETIVLVRAEMRRVSETDPLTGALNRRGLAAAAVDLARRSDRRGTSLVLAAIDFDEFKRVNDTRGHAFGDQALRETSQAWRDALGRDGIVARVGGDEFVLVVSQIRLGDVRAILDQLRADATTGWSAGTVERERGEELEAAFARADEALYRAKRGG